MKDIAIVYSSKCGHTKQYADWLKAEIDADVVNVTSFAANRMVSYRLVIFACGVYGDKLSIMDYVKKNISAVPMQKVMVMAVSWYTNDSEEAKQKLIADNYPDQFKHNNVPMYVINSGIDKKQISPADKVKLVAAKAMIDKKDGRSSDDINALAIIKGYADQTSKDNLASIKKGIDEFFNPPKKEPEFVAPPPKPAAPAPAKAAEPVQKPAPAAENPADALSNSVEEAFKNLYAPKPKPAAPAPEPKPTASESAAEAPAEPAAPVARFNENGEIVVSSIVEAIKTLNGEPTPQPKPAPITRAPAPEPEPVQAEEPAVEEVIPEPQPEPIPEPIAEVIPEPEPIPEPAAEVIPEPEPIPEPAAEVIPEPQLKAEPVHTEPEPVQAEESAKPKNSYMELFAKRRRSAAEAASAAREAAPVTRASEPVVKEPEPQIIPEPAVSAPKPAVSAPKPAVSAPKPAVDEFNFADFALEEKPKEYTPAPAANASYDDDFGGYDFISDDKPKVSKRALSAVQDLAKAKEAAEKEAAKLAAAKSADTLAQEPDSLAAKNDILEKMKHDIEALAEESEYTQNFEVEETESEPEIDVELASAYEPVEESGDGLEAFAFTDSADYDLEAEFAEPPKLEDMDTPRSESRTNFDLRKLQEEIEESIETNRAAKERMMSRYGKRQKEEVHNPFAVQFEEDESAKKGKKSKKQQPSAEPKRLADPIDPDIFFSRTTAKNQEFNTGSMPEIKFKNQK